MEELKAIAIRGVARAIKWRCDGVTSQSRWLRANIIFVPPARLHTLQGSSLFAESRRSIVTHSKLFRIHVGQAELVDEMKSLLPTFTFDLCFEAVPDFIVLHSHITFQYSVPCLFCIFLRTCIYPITIQFLLNFIVLRRTISIWVQNIRQCVC